MTGINSGILTNAYPLTAEQIKELERQVLENDIAFVYLDENSELCFMMSSEVDGIKDLAWHNAYKLFYDYDAGLFTKKAYIKTGLKTFVHTTTVNKQTINDTWNELSSLLDEGLLDEFILD